MVQVEVDEPAGGRVHGQVILDPGIVAARRGREPLVSRLAQDRGEPRARARLDQHVQVGEPAEALIQVPVALELAVAEAGVVEPGRQRVHDLQHGGHLRFAELGPLRTRSTRGPFDFLV